MKESIVWVFIALIYMGLKPREKIDEVGPKKKDLSSK